MYPYDVDGAPIVLELIMYIYMHAPRAMLCSVLDVMLCTYGVTRWTRSPDLLLVSVPDVVLSCVGHGM